MGFSRQRSSPQQPFVCTSSRLSIPILSLFLFAGLLSRTESLPTTTSPRGSAYRARGRFRLPPAPPPSWLPPPLLAGTAGPSKKYPLICAGGIASAAAAAAAVDTAAAGLPLLPAPFSLSTSPSRETAAILGGEEEEPSCARRGTGDPLRQMTSAWGDGEGRGGGVFRARPGVKAPAAGRFDDKLEVEAAAEELGVPACDAAVPFAKLRAGDGGVPAAVDGVPMPEALLLLALKGLLWLLLLPLVVLGLLLLVVGPAGDEEKKLLMSVRPSVTSKGFGRDNAHKFTAYLASDSLRACVRLAKEK